jgi:hypothetical protein
VRACVRLMSAWSTGRRRAARRSHGRDRPGSVVPLYQVVGLADGAMDSIGVAEFPQCPRRSVGGQPHALRAVFRVREPVSGEFEGVAVAAGVVLAEAVRGACPCLQVRVSRVIGQAEGFQAVGAGQREFWTM